MVRNTRVFTGLTSKALPNRSRWHRESCREFAPPVVSFRVPGWTPSRDMFAMRTQCPKNGGNSAIQNPPIVPVPPSRSYTSLVRRHPHVENSWRFIMMRNVMNMLLEYFLGLRGKVTSWRSGAPLGAPRAV